MKEEGSRRPALSDVSFQLRKGQQIAFVGPSGAGKSTLASLLLRFMEPDEGEILADGRPVGQMSPQQWRRQVAWIPQRPYLFNASIADNIRFGKADATMEEIKEAAHRARLSEFYQDITAGI
ncbi:MAG: ATP-binding cassette domain-containing protein [Ktedonobacteraceae bacterium]|nr:ATP-binding cassette domain-containing protein [Ktedonobacteraceae bacterium]